MNTAKNPHPDFSINAFKEGQPRAFSYVFRHYYPALRFFATRLIQDAPAAEDIAQETFIKLWEKHSGFHSAEAIKAFLYITTRNACFNFIKRAQAGAKNHKLWSNAWDESDDFVLNHLTRAEVVREIYLILDMLPTECRKIMRYYFIEGKETQEIASILNLSIHTVKNQKARAISLIRKKLGQRSLMLLMLVLLELRGQMQSSFNTATASNANTCKASSIMHKCVSYTIFLLNFFWLF